MDSLLQLPNLVTLLRLILTGPIVWFLFNHYMVSAFILFLIAGITDWLDGWLARSYVGGDTPLGAFLDPMADKVLLISTFLTFGYLSYISPYIVAIAVGRDISILLGILCYRLWIGSLHYQPIFISKLNTVLQIVLVLGILVQHAVWVFPSMILQVIEGAMVMTSLISFLQYAKIWVLNIKNHVNRHQ